MKMSFVTLPELGEGIATAVVSSCYFKAGDRVQRGDDVVEVVTDKAAFNICAEDSGILEEIFVSEGQEVKIGEKLFRVEGPGEKRG